MSYLVFARKFRPQTFDDVIGQEPIVTTLKNAILKNRVAQSFLFTGSRGVGKTSTARILAKALNCEKGPTPTPCNQCSICEEITEGSSLDILEIDGASNRGIDEIRALRDGVKFKPTRGRYKIYIIDEVHMLTGEAFNALLKTLEEPPEHVKFIFATTEAHKVPLTILSRCQRYNFRRIPAALMIQTLREVANKEKLKVKDDVLFLIAKHSEGSLRDGESLLDQLASYGDGEVAAEDVAFTLGLTGDDVYFLLLGALKARDGKKVLATVGKVIEAGKDLVQFSRGLLEIFRDLLVSQVGKPSDELVEGTAERIAEIKQFQSAFSPEELLFSVTLLQQLLREIRWSSTPRFLIEMCLLKITNRSNLRPLDDILKELKSLEKTIPQKSGAPERGPRPTEARLPAPPAERGEPARQGPRTGSLSPTHLKSIEGGSDLKAAADQDDVKVSQPRGKKEDLTGQILGETASMVQHSPSQVAGGARTDDTSTSGSQKFDTVTLNEVGRVWPDLLERVKAVKMSCGTFLAEAEAVDVMEGIVVFGLPGEFKFHQEALEKQDNRELVRLTLSSLLGRNVGVSFVVTEAIGDVEVKKPKPESANPKGSEIISSALDIFEGSRIVRLE
ncbi:MAG: DNA polymerase III, subunit gamma and tau [Omnitrophica bacterium RIFCSPLOWO2_12_FULL_50_11]|nr:MAG: DNA polymerase III, subunit gamma and tau [Omnitrophica bacterium RIFCSPLOWO2_12_FULL_50_11]